MIKSPARRWRRRIWWIEHTNGLINNNRISEGNPLPLGQFQIKVSAIELHHDQLICRSRLEELKASGNCGLGQTITDAFS